MQPWAAGGFFIKKQRLRREQLLFVSLDGEKTTNKKLHIIAIMLNYLSSDLGKDLTLWEQRYKSTP